MSSGALRAAWEAAQKPQDGLRAAWEAANASDPAFADVTGGSSSTAPDPATRTRDRIAKEAWSQPVAKHPLLQALGVVASTGKRIPLVEALQGFAGSMVSRSPGARMLGVKPVSYSESLKDIRGAEAAAPRALTLPAEIAGGALAAMVLPKVPGIAQGGAMLQGAQYGALEGLLGADPDQTVADRLHEATKSMAFGAAGGKVAEGVGNIVRPMFAKTSGQVAGEIDDAITAANVANYGRAAKEGVEAGGSSPALAKALERPRIAKYVEMVRDGEEGSPVSDADVARDVLKRMSKHVRGLKKKNDLEYDPAIETEIKKLGGEIRRLTAATAERGTVTTELPAIETAQSPPPDIRTALREFQARPGIAAARREGTVAQQQARQALERHAAEGVVSPPLRGAPGPRTIDTDVPAVMPSLPGARSDLARMEGERRAFETAQDAFQRILQGAKIAGRNQLKKSPETFSKAIKDMTPEEARRALQGGLARMKEGTGSTNPIKAALRYNRVSPFVQQLDEQAGNDWPAILRALGIATP